MRLLRNEGATLGAALSEVVGQSSRVSVAVAFAKQSGLAEVGTAEQGNLSPDQEDSVPHLTFLRGAARSRGACLQTSQRRIPPGDFAFLRDRIDSTGHLAPACGLHALLRE